MSGIIDVDSVNNNITIKDADIGCMVAEFELSLKNNTITVMVSNDGYALNSLGPKDVDILIQGLTNLRKQLKDVK